MKKDKQPKRTLVFNYHDGIKYPASQRKEISKAVELNVSDSTKSFMYIEMMKDGTYRLSWTKNFLDERFDISALQNITIERTKGEE